MNNHFYQNIPRSKPVKTRWSGKPYNFFGDYLWEKYGTRMLKLPVNAGFSCPNRDGAASSHGCIFCDESGSASPTTTGTKDIKLQMLNAKESFRRSSSATRYMAYLQAFSNTYAPLDLLKRTYDAALSFDDVLGLMIATRPDCLSDEILDLIASYKKENFELWLELGMQSMHDKSLHYLNRGHTHNDTKKAIFSAWDRNIPVCVHIILGIPGESWEMMMQTAVDISSLPVNGVKIHHLHVVKNTHLETLYKAHAFTVLEFEEYISAVCDFLERLRQDILIHRLMGDRSIDSLIAPKWAVHKGTVLKAISDELDRRGTHQGFLCI